MSLLLSLFVPLYGNLGDNFIIYNQIENKLLSMLMIPAYYLCTVGVELFKPQVDWISAYSCTALTFFFFNSHKMRLSFYYLETKKIMDGCFVLQSGEYLSGPVPACCLANALQLHLCKEKACSFGGRYADFIVQFTGLLNFSPCKEVGEIFQSFTDCQQSGWVLCHSLQVLCSFYFFFPAAKW